MASARASKVGLRCALSLAADERAMSLISCLTLGLSWHRHDVLIRRQNFPFFNDPRKEMSI